MMIQSETGPVAGAYDFSNTFTNGCCACVTGVVRFTSPGTVAGLVVFVILGVSASDRAGSEKSDGSKRLGLLCRMSTSNPAGVIAERLRA